MDKDGLFTGAKIRWEPGFDSAYRETLHASCEMEIENQKKSMDQYTHIDGRCQSVTSLGTHIQKMPRPRDRNSTGSSIMEWLIPMEMCRRSSSSFERLPSFASSTITAAPYVNSNMAAVSHRKPVSFPRPRTFKAGVIIMAMSERYADHCLLKIDLQNLR